LSAVTQLRGGIVKNNPVFVLGLGLCPTLAVTTKAKNGLAMGLAASAVLIASNVIISLVRRFIPAQVRIPCFIVIIASFVTMVELVIKATSPTLNDQLGIFIPLIVVNCIILGRAEGFASRNGVIPSIADGAGIGLGFTLALLLLGSTREILGNGTFWDIKIARGFEPASIMIQAPGAFLALGLYLGLFRWLGMRRARRFAAWTAPGEGDAASREGGQ